MKEDTDRVTDSIVETVASLSNPPTEFNCKIFKVADHLRQVKAEDYEPKILAIGPIHREKKHLMNMEKHKVRYLQQLLQRRPDLSIHKLVETLWEMKEYALVSYPDLDPDDIDMDEFVRTLLLDGCFVIELLLNYYDDYCEISRDGDPILKSETLRQIVHDLMLLENQLPFPILNMLFDMTNTGPYDSICHMVLVLVGTMFQWSKHSFFRNPEDEILRTDHFLGLVYRYYFPFFIIKTSDEGEVEGMNSRIHISSASEMTEAGIQLTPCKENSLSFDGRELKIPSLHRVLGSTESLLRNLIAYEQLCLPENHTKHLTGYVFFVHSLIRSTKDVEILRRSGVISNSLGGDAKVYQMFDGLANNCLWSSNFGSSDVFKRLNEHCSRRRAKWMAKLWTDYFNSPWSLIKFLAAVLLLGISIAELVIAMETFKHSEDVVKVRIV